MSPSVSAKNGVRYRLYVSSALLRGRKAAAGSVRRISAAEIEGAVLAYLKSQQQQGNCDSAPAPIDALERVVVASDRLLVTIAGAAGGGNPSHKNKFSVSAKATGSPSPPVDGRDAPL